MRDEAPAEAPAVVILELREVDDDLVLIEEGSVWIGGTDA